MITLNIGLDRNTGGANTGGHTLATVADYFSLEGHRVVSHRLEESATELTLVVRLDIDRRKTYGGLTLSALYGTVYRLCKVLAQDCIAVEDGDTQELIGPNAAKWGAFNPEYFLR